MVAGVLKCDHWLTLNGLILPTSQPFVPQMSVPCQASLISSALFPFFPFFLLSFGEKLSTHHPRYSY